MRMSRGARHALAAVVLLAMMGGATADAALCHATDCAAWCSGDRCDAGKTSCTSETTVWLEGFLVVYMEVTECTPLQD
jgi:hypothetical protein